MSIKEIYLKIRKRVYAYWKVIMEDLRYPFYVYIYIPLKVNRIRRQKQITVVFVITVIDAWKTESLFLRMRNHPRFNPILLVLPARELNEDSSKVEKVLIGKGYPYTKLKQSETIKGKLNPDIIFYQKPYWWVIDDDYYYRNNTYALFCYAHYGFHTINSPKLLNHKLLNYAWQVYFENESCAKDACRSMNNNGRNIVVAGTPMMDEFSCISDATTIEGNKKKKKTIIWAPHHTIPNTDQWLPYSTFLDYSNFMVHMAEKYSESVDIVFKPHPSLAITLEKVWGKEKVDEYYNLWNSMPNCKLANGEYLNLFLESDAMIHDCSSFIIEYMYFNKPVMFLTNGYNHKANLFDYAKLAFDLHYKGQNEKDIEEFIKSVINGEDKLVNKRKEFVDIYLRLSGGSSACENIISAILGE